MRTLLTGARELLKASSKAFFKGSYIYKLNSIARMKRHQFKVTNA